MPIQQMLLGVGGKEKTYVDDVFSTFLYKQNGTSLAINNGINLNENGGLVWFKTRTGSGDSHALIDSVRGGTKELRSDSTSSEGTQSGGITSFNTTGFTIGDFANINSGSNLDMSSWTFRKAPGFFDIQTYTGGGDNTSGSIGNPNFQVNHDLGCIPGMILIKRTNATTDWLAWHKGEEGTLNSAGTLSSASALPLADVTDTYFKFAAGNGAYNDPGTFVAYIFAGGESTAATARSVDFNSGDSEYLSIADDAAFQLGTGDFTIEFWWKGGEGSGNYQQVIGTQSVYAADSGIWRIGTKTNANKIYFSSADGSGFDEPVWDVNVNDHSWHHIAITRASGYIYCYVDGTKQANVGESNHINRSLTTSNSLFIGKNGRDGSYIGGRLSNVRIVKGTAVYTSSFKPPTEPLTNITNTTLLCCNNSSTTGKTVGPSITANNSPTAKTDSPFDDPAAFIFGNSGDQSIIKCGSYVGNGNSDGPEISLGWEPQWLVTKCATNSSGTTTSWNVFDSVRGAPVVATQKKRLWLNGNWVEDSSEGPEFTSDGFKIDDNSGYNNTDGETYIYIAIRRNDGTVGKPIDTGTNAFTMDTGNSSSTIPTYDSAFPVDFAFYRKPAATFNPWAGQRSMGQQIMSFTSTNGAASGGTDICWDSNNGWASDSSHDSSYQSWMWRRHAGFDVVTYDGVSGIRDVPHSLGKAAEMIWIKRTDGGTDEWVVGATALDSGGWNKFLKLNGDDAEASAYGTFNSTAPSATHFSLGTASRANYNGQKYVAMLFASIAGVSKVGTYVGAGSSNKTVTVGFQPRLVIIKNIDSGTEWACYDTLRGINSSGSGGDHFFYLNKSNQEWDDLTHIDISSTGFTLAASSWNGINQDSNNFLYYVHA